ncbi:hypothetical protein DVH24_006857 [Malus domestica]|uniref:Uncharacterized protein n=1 Tax=Malus domestica TaxID=3750 RepID=A0A498JAT3_MALDO|nr:hypothetical protein DVH24_006857 [Malus domestica]
MSTYIGHENGEIASPPKRCLGAKQGCSTAINSNRFLNRQGLCGHWAIWRLEERERKQAPWKQDEAWRRSEIGCYGNLQSNRRRINGKTE